MRISGPIAAIIITLIITSGALIGSGSFDSKPENYATIYFDGGYERIGIVREERVFTSAVLKFNNNVEHSGDFSSLINLLNEMSADQGNASELNLADGVSIEASAGIIYIASESDFTLTEESLFVKSTQLNPVNQNELITKLKNIETSLKDRRETISSDALKFGPAPPKDGIINQIVKAAEKLKDLI